MPAHDAQFVHRRHVKEADRIVTASGNQDLAIGCERHGADPELHRFWNPPSSSMKKPRVSVESSAVSSSDRCAESSPLRSATLPRCGSCRYRTRWRGECHPGEGHTDRPVVVVLVLPKRVMRSVPVVTSQILMSLLWLPRANMSRRGQGQAAHIVIVAREQEFRGFARFGFQRRMVRSSLPEANVRPSGVNTSARMSAVCPRNERKRRPVSISHTRTYRSTPPLTMVWPSGA